MNRPVGCGVGRQIREDAAMDILRRTVQSVQIDREAVIANLTRIAETVLGDSRDGGGERGRLERELEQQQNRKLRALESVLDETISRADWCLIRQRCDDRIRQIHEQLSALPQHPEDTGGRIRDIRETICAIVCGERGDDAFYGRLLDRMTVYGDGRVEVALRLLPDRWTYVLRRPGEKAAHDGASVPISVSRPFSSGQGME